MIKPNPQPTKDVKVKGEDMVAHPPHYTQHPSGVECIEITRHMGFNLGNALKYIWRADLKWDAIQDLEKAVWYLADEIERRTQAKAKKEASVRKAAKSLLRLIRDKSNSTAEKLQELTTPTPIGFTYLGEKDIIQDGDEFLQDGEGDWVPVPAIWFGNFVSAHPGFKFRREVG